MSENKKTIYYLAHYDILYKENAKSVHPGAVNKIDYVIYSLIKQNFSVQIISLAQPCRKGKYKSENTTIKEGVKLKHFHSFYTASLIGRILRKIYYYFSIFFYFCCKFKKDETLIIYHSISLIWLVKFLKKHKNTNIIYDISEIYGDQINNPKVKSREEKNFKNADAYIFPNEYMAKIYNNQKPFCILYGTYKYDYININSSFNDNKIHCVYSGTLSETKRGASNAVKAGKYLSKDYHIHILGISSEQEIHFIKKLINEVKMETECEITYDGTLFGNDYNQYLKKCTIGLATQTVYGKLNETSFPSKILTYMNAGLNVVSSDISVVKNSKLADAIEFYRDDDPKSIAEAIVKQSNGLKNSSSILQILDEEFSSNLTQIINGIRKKE